MRQNISILVREVKSNYLEEGEFRDKRPQPVGADIFHLILMVSEKK